MYLFSNASSLVFLFFFFVTRLNLFYKLTIPLYTSANFCKAIDLTDLFGVVASRNWYHTIRQCYLFHSYIYTAWYEWVEPSVNVSYNSQGGPGWWGFGWNIGGLSVISRSGKNVYHNGFCETCFLYSNDLVPTWWYELKLIVGANGDNLTEYKGLVTESYSIVCLPIPPGSRIIIWLVSRLPLRMK